MAHQAPTKNWVFNQVGIRVTDIRRSQTFYEEVFGMKPLKTLVWDDLTFVLLGYSRGPEGSLYDREGVLELVYSEHARKPVTNTVENPDFGLVKMAVTVPDMAASMEYLRSCNVKILKEPESLEGEEVVSAACACALPNSGKNLILWEVVKKIALVEDPDGYLVEIIEQLK